MTGITTCLWFSSDLEGALQRYTSLFPDSEVYSLQAGDGYALAEWRMNGTRFRAIMQPSEFRFTEAVSLSVDCADQAEVDRYWDGLLAGGGEESQCGWLKDPWGVSWQIVPRRLAELLGDPDPPPRRRRPDRDAEATQDRRRRTRGRRGRSRMSRATRRPTSSCPSASR